MKFFKEIDLNKLMLIMTVSYFLIELFHLNNPLYSFNNFYEKLQIVDYFYQLFYLYF